MVSFLLQGVFSVGLSIFFMASSVLAGGTVGCSQGDVLMASGVVKLSTQCRYLATVRITTSNTFLDCQGAVIDGEGKRQVGIEVDSAGKPLKNVEIRNCTVVNTRGQGVVIGWSAPDRDKADAFDRKTLYSLTPTDVRLINVTVRGAGGVGIYVDDYVTNTLIDQCKVSDSGSVGIYLEHSSKSTTISNSDVSNNGFKLRREGIAIDSSRDNVVTKSSITGNFAGGIYVYRNCSEHLAEDPKQVVRWQSADSNVISFNSISDGGAGIWVASRQSMDLSKMQCGNGYYAEGKFTLDSAKFNKLLGNRINNVDYGIIIEDDDNLVKNNFLNKIRKVGVKVGSIPRYQYLVRPVKGVGLVGNYFQDVANTISTVGNAEISVQDW